MSAPLPSPMLFLLGLHKMYGLSHKLWIPSWLGTWYLQQSHLIQFWLSSYKYLTISFTLWRLTTWILTSTKSEYTAAEPEKLQKFVAINNLFVKMVENVFVVETAFTLLIYLHLFMHLDSCNVNLTFYTFCFLVFIIIKYCWLCFANIAI